MDFFEAQARAKKRTSRLVALFVLAVIGIIAVGYFAFIFLIGARLQPQPSRTSSSYSYNTTDDYAVEQTAPPRRTVSNQQPRGAGVDLWQPKVLTIFSLITVTVVGLASLFKWMELRSGGSAVARAIGGREIPLQTTDPRERQLLNIVEEMSIASGMPMPSVYVLDSENGINAFAAGLTTSDAVVAVTRGTLDKLTRDEIQAVIAHEFSHILNGDMRLNTRLTAVLFGILVIGLLGRGILQSLRFARPSRSKDKEGGVVFVIIGVGIIMMILGYVGYFFGRLIQAAVSRQREFLADASSVQFTRNPGGITGALKKIGGYALGSGIQSQHAAEFSHFFFAQAFSSAFGPWATHPPLDTRIRAVDASFDGKFFEPPQVVDVSRQSWSEKAADSNARSAAAKKQASPAALSPLSPIAMIATIGTLDSGHTQRAQTLAENIPTALREAARAPAEATALICGLLLDTANEQIRSRQLDIIKRHGGDAVMRALEPLLSDLRKLTPESRLPLLLLTLPAIRQLPPLGLSRFLETLDELVHADDQISTFEFAMQKVLTHHLQLASNPAGRRETYSPQEVSAEISTVLSFAARMHASDEAVAQNAFTTGASQFSGLHPALTMRSVEESDIDQLDGALDKLALAYGPVKKRVLTAVATTLASDGRVDADEAELLRALASALDCPMPVAG